MGFSQATWLSYGFDTLIKFYLILSALSLVTSFELSTHSQRLHFSPQLRITLFILCAAVALRPLPYVIARPHDPRCVLPKGHHDINDSSSRIRINYQIFKVASKTPSYVQIVQLFCKTGYFLALNVTAKRNRIIGIVNQSSESSK